MSEKKWTDRDVLMAKRGAVGNALRTLSDETGGLRSILPSNWQGIDAFAARLYPIPKVERPRVVKDEVQGLPAYWRYVNGRIEWSRRGEDVWACTGGMYFTPERVRLLADLLANPTEMVEADE